MLKLKLQYFGYLIQRTDSLEKILMVGKIEGWRRRGRQRMRWLGDITDAMDMSLIRLWVWTGRPGVLQSTGSQRVRHDQATEPNWTEGIRIRCNSVNIFFWNIIDYNIIPQWLSGKESACNAGDASLIPGLERSPAGGNGNLLQYSCIENLMDRGARWVTVYGVTKSQTWLRGWAHMNIIIEFQVYDIMIWHWHALWNDHHF